MMMRASKWSAGICFTLVVAGTAVPGDEVVLKGHKSLCNAVAWSPDGKTLASGGADGTVRLWNPATTAEMRIIKSGYIACLAWSPDGKTLAAAGGRTLKLLDPATGKETGDIANPGASYQSVAWNPDGKSIAVAGEEKVIRIWDSAKAKQLLVLTGHEKETKGVCWTADGSLLISSAADGNVRAWETKTWKLVGKIQAEPKLLYAISVSPDGKTLATSGTTTIRLWDTKTWTEKSSFATGKDSNSAAMSLSWRPDGKAIATGDYHGLVRIWDPESGMAMPVKFAAAQRSAYSVVWSPDGKFISNGGFHGDVSIWEVPEIK